jgi:hypothetical protein
MKNLAKSAFITMVALICYAGFATAQTISFDSPGNLGTLVNDLKGGSGGYGGGNAPNVPPPSHGGFNDYNSQGAHGGFNNHNGPGAHGGFNNYNGSGAHGGFNNYNSSGAHGGFNNHNGPGTHGGFNNHKGLAPLPGPWHSQSGQWHPNHNGHPDWDHNDWGNNHWNQHSPEYNDWWNNYNGWWAGSVHPFSMYRTVCTVTPGVSAKGFIVEQTMLSSGRATFYYYSALNSIISTSNQMNGVYSGGNGTPVFDSSRAPVQADHCFLAITQ